MSRIHTIGFFVAKLDEEYQKCVWNGIVDESKKTGVNLICFPGDRINSKVNFEYQANILYKLAGRENIDGIIVLSNTLATFLNQDEIVDFCHSYQPIPVVSVGLMLPDIPSVVVDNDTGMRKLISHLTEYHHYKRIAFITGPAGHQESEKRLCTLKEVLYEHDLFFDRELTVNGNFLKESGYHAIETLLDERKKSFDLVVAANDHMAVGAIEALQYRGIYVPDQIAVVGFDDIEESRYYNPPLTTVYQPIYEQGRIAVSNLLELINKTGKPGNVTLPSNLVVRQSCGCFSRKANPIIINSPPVEELCSDTVLKECKNGFSPSLVRILKKDEGIKGLFNAFIQDINHNDSDIFITRLNKTLRNTHLDINDISSFHHLISIFRKYALNLKVNQNKLLRASSILEQALVLVGEISQRSQAYITANSEALFRKLRDIGDTLITTFDMEKLIYTIIDALKMLGINCCFFSLYDNDNPCPEWSRLLLAYSEKEYRILGTEGIRFSSKYLFLQEMLPAGKRPPMILEPLYFQNDQLGFIIFGLGPSEPIIYDLLRKYISSALKGAILMQEDKKNADILEREVIRKTFDLTKSNKKLQWEIQQRKNIELALKESEKNLKSITEAMPIPLIISRMSDGNILYSNKPFLKAFGINQNELSKKRLCNFYTDVEYIKEIIERLKKCQSLSNIELSVLREDGTTFWVISSFQTLDFQGEKGVLTGFYDITERKRLEKEILEILGREKRRIGQDLHDDLCNNLAGIAVMLSALEKEIREKTVIESQRVSVISQLINDSIVQAKNLAQGLYPVELEEDGIVNTLKEFAKNIEFKYGVSCKLSHNNQIQIKDNYIMLHLYRIAQEAVNNAIHHGKPDNIDIHFSSTQEKIALMIKDNGMGFCGDIHKTKGMGLRIMNHRANMIGGKLDIKCNNGKGICISCTIYRKNKIL